MLAFCSRPARVLTWEFVVMARRLFNQKRGAHHHKSSQKKEQTVKYIHCFQKKINNCQYVLIKWRYKICFLLLIFFFTLFFHISFQKQTSWVNATLIKSKSARVVFRSFQGYFYFSWNKTKLSLTCNFCRVMFQSQGFIRQTHDD